MNKRIPIASAALLLVIGAFGGAVPATAEPSVTGPPAVQATGSTWDPLQSVEKLGNLASIDAPAGAKPTAGTSDFAGTVPDGVVNGPVDDLSITPVVEGGALLPSARVSNGHSVTVYSAQDHGFVIGKNVHGNTAGFVSIKDSSAPTSYKFAVGEPANKPVLELQQDGSILVRDAGGNFVNLIQKPWAKDASGTSLRTHYTIESNIITQEIELSGADFPVVADPSFGCGFANCTIQFNKSETRDWATASPPVLAALVAGCAAAGGPPAGVACGAASAALVSAAILANNHGECVELHFAGVSPAVTWWPWNYSGGYCS